MHTEVRSAPKCRKLRKQDGRAWWSELVEGFHHHSVCSWTAVEANQKVVVA